MIEELNPRAQALLEAARGGLGPDDAVLARVRHRVVTGAGSAAAVTGLGAVAKLAIVGVVAAVATGGWLATRPRHERAVAAGPLGLAAPVEPASTSRFETAAPLDPPRVAPPSRSSPVRRTTALAAASLADEVALVDAAMAALRGGDPAAALAATERHAARIGARGQLAEEAAALRIEALCRLGDARADAAWETFATRWPASPQRMRIAAACKDRP